ncbi:MAG TPA: DUF1285 domain-containing protein [Rhizomicrobium sp.]|jgi:hypothetical protein
MSADELNLGIASILRDAAQGRLLPPVARWNPTLCGAVDIRIARDGTWFHEGEPIRRHAMVRLFSTILRRENDEFYLVTPAEKLRIEVEDAPFVAVLMRAKGDVSSQTLVFTTNVGDECMAGSDHPIRMGECPFHGTPIPYILIRQGLEARIARSVFYELVDMAHPAPGGDDSVIGVRSGGVFFPLGSVT